VEEEEPGVYLSKNGTAVRVHRDGSTSVIHVLDPAGLYK
jgi:hypothetical protein